MKPTVHLGRTPFRLLVVFAAVTLYAEAPDTPTFVLSPGDVTEATVDSSGGARLQVTLTPEKRAELLAFTTRNLNKQVRIVIGDELRSEPFIRERIAGPTMEVFVKSPEHAIATVKALMTSRVRFEQLHKWTDSSGKTHYAEKPPGGAAKPGPVEKPTLVEDKKAFEAVQGSWRVVKATMNGKEARDASLLAGTWTFKGNELQMQSPQEGKARFTLKLDGKAEPKAFQLTPVEPATEASGWMLLAREGDNLKVAFYDNLRGRPDGFEPREPRSEPALVVVTLAPKP